MANGPPSTPLACPGFPMSAPHPANTWLLSGLPRAGTSLCCRLAGELPSVVALTEPMNGPSLAEQDDAAAARSAIAAFAAAARERILATGRAQTLHMGGQLPEDLVAPPATATSPAALREPVARRGDIPIHKPLAADFTLIVKQNALFAALLPVLQPRFDCLALVRNPFPVLASWQTVRLPVQRGRLPAGERFDAALRVRLAAEPDGLKRQLAILNWFFAQYRRHLPSASILRYEEVVASGGEALFRQLGADGPRQPLRLRVAAVAPATADRLLAALLADDDGAWRHFYQTDDVRTAAEACRRASAAT